MAAIPEERRRLYGVVRRAAADGDQFHIAQLAMSDFSEALMGEVHSLSISYSIVVRRVKSFSSFFDSSSMTRNYYNLNTTHRNIFY